MKTLDELKAYLAENELTETVFLENPDYVTAIVGITESFQLVYDYDLMIDHLIEHGMEIDEAYDTLDYDTLGAISSMGDFRPIVMTNIERI
jgi:hypothetical protein